MFLPSYPLLHFLLLRLVVAVCVAILARTGSGCNLVFPQRALLVFDLIYVQTATQPIIKSIVAENDNARVLQPLA